MLFRLLLILKEFELLKLLYLKKELFIFEDVFKELF
jgi:hypothetical protein